MLGKQLGPVLIATAHPLERLALADVVKQAFGCSSITSFDNLDQLKLKIDQQTSLMVLDISVPGLESIEVIRGLHIQYPLSKIVVMSTHCRVDRILSVLGTGAHGFIPKTLSRSELVAAFRRVADGQIYVPPEICELATHEDVHHRPLHQLSERQRQVLRLVCEGNSNKEIGRALCIAEATVKVHVSAAFRIMGVHNRARAVAAFREFDGGQGSLSLTG